MVYCHTKKLNVAWHIVGFAPLAALQDQKVTDRGNPSDQPFTKSHGFCAFFFGVLLLGCSVVVCFPFVNVGTVSVASCKPQSFFCCALQMANQVEQFFPQRTSHLEQLHAILVLGSDPLFIPKLPVFLGKIMIILAGQYMGNTLG